MKNIGVDLSQIKKIGSKYIWSESIGVNISYETEDSFYNFKLVGYDKNKQRATVEFEGKNYFISSISLKKGRFTNIVDDLRYKDIRFKYEKSNIIKTIKKSCLIVDKFKTKESKKHYICECLDCGIRKEVTEEYLIYKGFTCSYCSDKISYPEKIILLLLKSIGIKYDYQKMFDWSKKVSCPYDKKPTNKIYDFYIPSLDIIIEVNGELHYQESKWSNSRPLSYVKENDKYKRYLANKNNIKEYIVIDCSISDLEYIKENILKSELNKIFDLSSIDWNEINSMSYGSLMKDCSDLWNSGVKSAQSIADKTGLSKATVITYLKRLAKLKLNDYDPKNELRNGARLTQEKNKKELICLNDRNKFKSIVDCISFYKELGIDFTQARISDVCRGKRNHHKGYQFKYVENLTEEEKIKYNIKD